MPGLREPSAITLDDGTGWLDYGYRFMHHVLTKLFLSFATLLLGTFLCLTPCAHARMMPTASYSLPEKEVEITETQIGPEKVVRWLSEGPIGEAGGMNLYEYVGNGPVIKIDRNGELGIFKEPSIGLRLQRREAL